MDSNQSYKKFCIGCNDYVPGGEVKKGTRHCNVCRREFYKTAPLCTIKAHWAKGLLTRDELNRIEVGRRKERKRRTQNPHRDWQSIYQHCLEVIESIVQARKYARTQKDKPLEEWCNQALEFMRRIRTLARVSQKYTAPPADIVHWRHLLDVDDKTLLHIHVASYPSKRECPLLKSKKPCSTKS